MKRMIITAALAVAVFALPVMGSAQYAPGYYQQPAACAPACAPQACAPTCSTCFNPLGIVGDVFRGVGSIFSGVGSIFGSTCQTNCY